MPTVSSCFYTLIHFSGGGQTDAGNGRRRRAAAGAVPAQRLARPKSTAPDGVHAGAAVPTGARVWQGELRLQTPAVRTGHGAQFTRDND